MTGVFAFPVSEIACRSCGATLIPRAKTEELCSACWDGFVYWQKRRGSKTEATVNQFLARRLFLEAERLKARGVTGRCEAVARHASRWVSGANKQCRHLASFSVNGRRVCGSHARRKDVVFVGETTHDPYSNLQRLMIELAADDLRFRECVTAAAKIYASH